MIIAPADDKHEAESSKVAVAREDAHVSTDDPPPSYTSRPQEPLLSTTSSLPKPSNFISISKLNGSVKGTWVIDPTLVVPTSFLPALAENETRKNFSVSSKNGMIDVDLTIMQANDNIAAESKKSAVIYLSSHNGMLTAKLHRPPRSLSFPRPSIFITISAYNGHINLRLPRSFLGPLTITTSHGSVRFSPDVVAAVTTFSDMRTKKCFVGDYSTWRDGETWTGDEAVIESKNGSVRIQFDDEVVPEGSKSPLFTMWSKLFGGWSG